MLLQCHDVLLKKPRLDMNNLKNYRPVSNLPFVSKIIEKVVASRIEDHLDKHKLHDNRRPAYHSFHSTETVLIRVHHDILRVLMNPTAEPMAICCDLSLGYDFIHENADLDIPKVYSKCWCNR
jgi:hypothetical protein